jgi:hypothetical protein
MADSRAVIEQNYLGRSLNAAPPYYFISCITDAMVSIDGSAIGISLYWVNSTGKTAIGTSETAGGGRIGVMNGDKFTPLPGVTGFAAIAW